MQYLQCVSALSSVSVLQVEFKFVLLRAVAGGIKLVVWLGFCGAVLLQAGFKLAVLLECCRRSSLLVVLLGVAG